LGLNEDIEKIQTTRNGRDVEIVFAPADLVAGRGREGGREGRREGEREGERMRSPG